MLFDCTTGRAAGAHDPAAADVVDCIPASDGPAWTSAGQAGEPTAGRARGASRAARVLGVASLGIGLAELAAPRAILRALGLGGSDGQGAGILRALGARELGHGLDILAHRDPTPGVRSRLAGDALDGVLLGVAATRTRDPRRFALVACAVLGIAALDLWTARRLSRR